MEIVHVNALSKSYGNKRGIEQLSFSIEEGEVFGFIGPNGAGKSTAIRTLLNYIYPTSGSATIFGLDIVKEAKEIRRHIGYLPSEINYYEDMKVMDLLLYSAKFYNLHSEARIRQLADRFDLDLKRKIEDLSFGNRKKVGIIQALLHEPKFIIMDEPTGGLDPIMQQVFFNQLLEEKARGATILFSSHILSEVQRLCDRVAMIKEGRLIGVESIHQLMENNMKKIAMKFADQTEVDIELDGLIPQESHGSTRRFLYKGNIQKLLVTLQPLPLLDLYIEEPSLEEIFLHLYEKESEVGTR